MKTIGIDIDKKRVICFAIEKDEQGNVSNITGKLKFFEVKDDQDNGQLKQFASSIQDYFNFIKPDAIAIQTRQTKGRFSAAPSSFKLEGLIQLYDKVDIGFISPQTIAAFYKKNELSMQCDNKYQENALKLANYMLNQ